MSKIFVASMLAKGNHVFQASITILDDGIKVRIPGFWRDNETYLSFDEIKGIELTMPSWYTVLIYSTVQFYARGIRVEAHGFTKSDAQQIKRLIEEGQRENNSASSSSPYSNMSKQEREIKEREVISRIDQKKYEREMAILDEQLKNAFEGYQKGKVFLADLAEKANNNAEKYIIGFTEKLKTDITPYFTNLIVCYGKQQQLLRLLKASLKMTTASYQNEYYDILNIQIEEFTVLVIKKKKQSIDRYDRFKHTIIAAIEEAKKLKQQIAQLINSEYWETSKNQKGKAKQIRKLLHGGSDFENLHRYILEMIDLNDSCIDPFKEFEDSLIFLNQIEEMAKNINSSNKKETHRISEFLELVNDLYDIIYLSYGSKFENEDLLRYVQ